MNKVFYCILLLHYNAYCEGFTFLFHCFFLPSKCDTLVLCRNPTLRECEEETHTPEMGTKGLPKVQSLISRVKTLCIGVFFISLESYQSVDVENGLA
jgi:hypothetical protein